MNEFYTEQLEANAQHLKRDLDFMLEQFRQSCCHLVARMDTQPNSKGQESMVRLNGSPRAYAQAQINGVGNITFAEAHDAILRYEKAWEDRADEET